MATSTSADNEGQTTRLRLRIPPDPRFARVVRDALIGFGLLHDVSESDLEPLLFAVGEALANAIQHASGDQDIDIRAEIDDRQITTTIVDRGRGFRGRLPLETIPLPDGLCERGRGIPIMQRWADIFDVQSAPGKGTTVTLGRYRRPLRAFSLAPVR